MYSQKPQKPQKALTNNPPQKLPKNPWYTIYTIFRCFLSPPPAKFLFFTLAMKVEKIASIAYRIDYQ